MSWARLRREVFNRDGGNCRVCGLRVGKVWDAGHLQDRIVAGADTLENLVLMCVHCNRTCKPITPSRREALAWMDMQNRPPPIDWEPIWQLASGKAADGTQALAEHERLE